VIDIACGAGRHAWVMASEFDWEVTGIDLSETLLNRASKGFQDNNINDPAIGLNDSTPVKIRDINNSPGFIRADMRQLPVESNLFGMATNLFTSFGYFDSDDDNLCVLKEMARVLIPGGMLIFDHMNLAWTLDNLVEEDTIYSEGIQVSQHRYFDKISRRLKKDISIKPVKGETRKVQESVRIYKFEEMEQLLTSAGFKTELVVGDYTGANYNPKTSKRMIICAKVEH